MQFIVVVAVAVLAFSFLFRVKKESSVQFLSTERLGHPATSIS